MLSKFSVKNFKNFKEEITIDFTASDYQFNQESVENGLVKKAIIYGPNASGKSNLARAVFDIVRKLTTYYFDDRLYVNYLNADREDLDQIADFKYEFTFKEGKVNYSYGKYSLTKLAYEELSINDNIVLSINKETGEQKINLSGAGGVTTNFKNEDISIVNYIDKNTVLDKDNKTNKLFKEFMSFINRMLFFKSLDRKDFAGFKPGSEQIDQSIINNGAIKEFEDFLNSAGITCTLDIEEVGGISRIVFVSSKGRRIGFFDYDAISTGTDSLSLFFYWLQTIEENSLVFIDEFDAFYHHSLSESIVKLLKKVSPQVILTTHNTSIMNNDLLRPDCYFVLNQNKIDSINKLTKKELRAAHNLERMYNAGKFG